MANVDFQDELAGVMDEVLPRSPGRRARRDTRSYYVDEDKDVRVGRPLYGASTFTTDPMMEAERNDPENIARRRAAEAELNYETRRKELLLERRELVYDSLKQRTELEAMGLNMARRNKVEADAMGFLADLSDLEDRDAVTWPAIQELQRIHKSAYDNPTVKDSLAGYEPLRQEWEREQQAVQQQQDAERKLQEAAGLSAGALGRDERALYDDQLSRGAAPASALAAIERRRAYDEAYDKFAESGIPTELLDSITVGDPETGEVGFDQKSLRRLRTGLGAIAKRTEKIEDIDKNIKAIEGDAKNPVTGMTSYTPAQTEALQMLKDARSELVKERLLAEKQLLGPSKAADTQDAANDLLNRALEGDGASSAAPAANQDQDQRARQLGLE